jgi:hypothetical protein
MLAKIILSSLFVLAVGCKQSSVSTVSDTGFTPEAAENKGACVVYKKDTKEIQATCFFDRTQESCNESFKMVYEDVAPGKYDKKLVLKTDCTEAKVKVAAELASGKISSSSGFIQSGKCVCGSFVQLKAKNRYCLVARKTDSGKWQAVTQLPLESDCKVQCDASTGLAANALSSTACKE